MSLLQFKHVRGACRANGVRVVPRALFEVSTSRFGPPLVDALTANEVRNATIAQLCAPEAHVDD